MKVIGKTGEKEYLVEITDSEIRKIYGETYAIEVKKSNGEMATRNHGGELKIGDKIDVSEHFQESRNIQDNFDSLSREIISVKGSLTRFQNKAFKD